MAKNIHPSFKGQTILLKVLKYMLLSIVLLPLVAMVLVVVAKGRQDSFKPEDALPLAFISGVLLVLLFVINRFLISPQLRRMRKVSQWLEIMQPQKMLFSLTGTMGFRGPLAALYEEGASFPASPLLLVELMGVAAKLGGFPLLPALADVYRDPLDSEKAVALKIGDMSLVGTAIPHESWREWKAKQKRAYRCLMAAVCIIPVVFVLTPGIELWKTYNVLRKAEASLQWPMAPARINHSRVEETWITEGKSHFRGYRAVVSYEYDVSGSRYSGDLIRFGYRPSRDERTALNEVKKYAAGTNVMAAVNPALPTEAVLEKGPSDSLGMRLKQHLILMAICAVMVLIVGSVVAFAAKRLTAGLDKIGW